jgi:hypothetical protein
MRDGDREPLVVLDIDADSRTMFDAVVRNCVEIIHPDQRQEAAELATRLDGGGPVATTPRVAWTMLQNALDCACQEMKDVCYRVQYPREASIDAAKARILCFTRELERLETLDVPAGVPA